MLATALALGSTRSRSLLITRACLRRTRSCDLSVYSLCVQRSYTHLSLSRASRNPISDVQLHPTTHRPREQTASTRRDDRACPCSWPRSASAAAGVERAPQPLLLACRRCERDETLAPRHNHRRIFGPRLLLSLDRSPLALCCRGAIELDGPRAVRKHRPAAAPALGKMAEPRGRYIQRQVLAT